LILNPSVQSLLQGLVDYAGLFPPAALPLSEVLARFGSYQESAWGSLLGRLVGPCSRVSELLALLNESDAFLISGLVDDPAQLHLVDDFHKRAHRRVQVDCLEAKFVPELAKDWQRSWNYRLFWEVSSDTLERASSLAGGRVGLKLRTGSVDPSAFPNSSLVCEFLQCCKARDLTYKFTAGLHHAQPGVYATTYDEDSKRCRMFGFLTLFLAGALWHIDRLDLHRLKRLLEDERPKLELREGQIALQGEWLSLEQIDDYRRRAGQSFGSCSFSEPVEELKELQWLK